MPLSETVFRDHNHRAERSSENTLEYDQMISGSEALSVRLLKNCLLKCDWGIKQMCTLFSKFKFVSVVIFSGLFGILVGHQEDLKYPISLNSFSGSI